MAEIENVMKMIGFAATKLKGRLDMIYGDRLDDHGRKFIGLHEIIVPLCSVARSVFQQLRGSTAKKSKQPGLNRLPLKLLPFMELFSPRVDPNVHGYSLPLPHHEGAAISVGAHGPWLL